MRDRSGLDRDVAPGLERGVVARVRAERLGAAIDEPLEARVGIFAADHPELLGHDGLYLGCGLRTFPLGHSAAWRGADGVNCPASVEPAIAVVVLAPPEIASATASK